MGLDDNGHTVQGNRPQAGAMAVGRAAEQRAAARSSQTRRGIRDGPDISGSQRERVRVGSSWRRWACRGVHLHRARSDDECYRGTFNPSAIAEARSFAQGWTPKAQRNRAADPGGVGYTF